MERTMERAAARAANVMIVPQAPAGLVTEARAEGPREKEWRADRNMTRAVEIALENRLDDAPTALGHALRRLRAERAGAPARVVTWASCLIGPPPGQPA